jgi:iron complex outermembrane receptor protein
MNTRHPFRILLVVALVAGSAVSLRAQSPAGPRDLAGQTLEDLLNIEITSASRKEQRIDDVPAAVYVITQEDIRRSGLRTLPELFRLVPGMQVAQLDSHNWAVSVRGFNSLFSNKLLVLVDGRTIYNRAYSGVIWSVQNLLLDDIDRIEVIRGPGATIWGANAVNGIINIITKSAADTKGTVARIGGGTFEGQTAALRYGGAHGNTAYRVYSQWADHGQSTLGSGVRGGDPWNVFSAGGRLDRTEGPHAFLLQGTFADSNTRQLGAPAHQGRDDRTSDTQQASALVRWTLTRTGGSALQIQAFVDYDRVRTNVPAEPNVEHVADLDLNYHVHFGTRHDLVAGGGYRHSNQSFGELPGLSVVPSASSTALANTFAQDEIALGRHVTVTLGSKAEHDSVAGWNVQPTARAMWTLGQSQHVWAGVSRALRSPSAYDLGVRAQVPGPSAGGLPTVVAISGNPEYQTEKLRNAEVGYRITLGPAVAVDVTTFRGHYSDLPVLMPGAPSLDFTTGAPRLIVPMRLENLLEADTIGTEVSTRWMPSRRFSLDGSYSYLQIERHTDVVGAVAAQALDDITPQHQWQLHSSAWLTRRIELGAALYHVGQVSNLAIPAYTRADLRFAVNVSDRLSVAVTGQNLTEREHAESVGDGLGTGVVPTLVPMSASAQLVWKF